MLDTKNLIAGVPTDAPLFRGAASDKLQAIVKMLSDASFHFADDTTSEWGRGGELVRNAARAINELALPFGAIQCLMQDKPQLVTLEMLVNATLKDARENK